MYKPMKKPAHTASTNMMILEIIYTLKHHILKVVYPQLMKSYACFVIDIENRYM